MLNNRFIFHLKAQVSWFLQDCGCVRQTPLHYIIPPVLTFPFNSTESTRHCWSIHVGSWSSHTFVQIITEHKCLFFFNIGCFSHKLWQHGGVLKAQKWDGTKSEIELFNGRRAESSQRRELREMTADWEQHPRRNQTYISRDDGWLKAFLVSEGTREEEKEMQTKGKEKKKHFQPALPPHHHSLGGTRDYGNV